MLRLPHRTRLRRSVLLGVAAGITFTLLPHTHIAATTEPAQPTVAPETLHAATMISGRSPVYIVGDSITYRSSHQVHLRAPRWEVDGVPGRNVRRLPELLEERLASTQPPKHVVIALGSNGHVRWKKKDYVQAVALLPATTRVTFTTMWRNPKRWGGSSPRLNKHSKLLRKYSRYVTQIAKTRPNTCLYNWRQVAKNRHKKLVLADGVHPTARGEKVWARGVVRTVRKCRTVPLVR